MERSAAFIEIEDNAVKTAVRIKCMLECCVSDMVEKNGVYTTDVPITLVGVDSVCIMEVMQSNDTVQ